MQTCSLFKFLSESTLSDLLDSTSIASLNINENLFDQGSEATHIFLLEKGYLKLVRSTHDGKEKIVEFISPGESFAEAVMFSDLHVYPVTATALAPSQIWCINSCEYTSILKKSTDACFAVMGEFSRRLHSQLSEIDNLSLHSATVRLIAYLLDEAEDTETGIGLVKLKYPKALLASRLSIKPETLSRTFAKLSKTGFISIDERRISLDDVDGLKQLLFSE